jgi:hypothetical protein
MAIRIRSLKWTAPPTPAAYPVAPAADSSNLTISPGAAWRRVTDFWNTGFPSAETSKRPPDEGTSSTCDPGNR